MTKLTKQKKLEKKSETYVQTICASSDPDLIIVKFQNDWQKTARGVAFTRHPLAIRVLGKND